MTTVDQWREGWTLGVDLRHSRVAREDVLRTIARTWAAAKLDGFLFAHERAIERQQCSCRDCPLHGQPVPGDEPQGCLN